MSGAQPASEFRNWSGSLRFTPDRIERPRSEGEVVELVRRSRDSGRTLRVVGTGHSSTRIIESADTLVSLEHLTGVITHEADALQATVWSGSTLRDLATELFGAGLALPNFGDVATQRVGGAIGTGTHGSGLHFPILSQMLRGGRMVAGTGEVVEFSENTPELLRAAQVALGVFGIFTHMRLQLVPVYTLRRREWCTTVEPCLEHLDELVRNNRHLDFYWYPRSDEVKLRLINPPGGGSGDLPYAALVEDRADWAHEIIPKHSDLPYRFDEMEYALPYEAGQACFRAVRQRILERWRATVGWRVLYRVVAADDAYLSPAHARLSANISLHQNAGLPFRDFFRDIEPILRDAGGRPHWAKQHTQRAPELKPLYPAWDEFLRQRQALDPDAVFLTPYFADLLGAHPPGRAQ